MSFCSVAQKRAWKERVAEKCNITQPLAQSRRNYTIVHRSTARYRTSVPLLSNQPRKSKSDFAKERLDEREFFLSLLRNSPTKRTTNSYISRFSIPKKPDSTVLPKVAPPASGIPTSETFDRSRLNKTGVNLGNLYVPVKAIEENPVFTQQPLPAQNVAQITDLVHIALVKLRQPQIIDDETLSGIGLTISQLVRLGLDIAVVVDCDGPEAAHTPAPITPEWQEEVHRQAKRIVDAISAHNKPGVIMVNDALSYSETKLQLPASVKILGEVEVQHKSLIVPLLESGIVPVITPIACATTLPRNVRVSADEVILALTREFSGISAHKTPDVLRLNGLAKGAKSAQEKFSLDRVIILDPLGGIASEERPDKSHVFINLEEEYPSIKAELLGGSFMTDGAKLAPPGGDEKLSVLGSSNPFSKFVEEELPHLTGPPSGSRPATSLITSSSSRHVKNLELSRSALQLLPPASSALIIDPSGAAASSQQSEEPETTDGVRTRRQKNPLIHNLLTDKPMTSSSLPLSRFQQPVIIPGSLQVEPNEPTFIKRGIPLTIIPDPRTHPWTTPGPAGTTLSLTDPQIDFPRLLHLIEDSFGRKLDVDHYLSRIRNRLAGIIVAGEYEGGAIFTWETPPNSPNSPPVPYLDKFAVLRRSQGSGGVADIVFRALLRQCFPKGCVWRSRTNNPVNKWYFERSAGSWKLPGGQWTMFWSVEDGYGKDDIGPAGMARTREERWKDWVDVCQGVAPSWSDSKAPD